MTSKSLLNLSFLGVVIVGGLQMFRVNAGFVTSYGGDVIGPVFLYIATRSGKTVLSRLRVPKPGPLMAAGGLFGLCALWEWCQRYDWSGIPLSITRGHFDPFDLAAYASSLVGCYLVDARWGERKSNLPPRTP